MQLKTEYATHTDVLVFDATLDLYHSGVARSAAAYRTKHEGNLHLRKLLSTCSTGAFTH